MSVSNNLGAFIITSIINTINGTVYKIDPWHLFVKLNEHINGTVHATELSNYNFTNINNLFAIDDEVTAKVIKINPDKTVILSIKQV